MLKQRCCHFGIPSATLAVHQPSSLPRLLEVIASPAATLLPATSQTERKRYFQAMGGNQSQEEQPQQQSLAQWMWQPDQGQQADHWEVPTIAPWPANPAMSWQATPGGVYMPGPPEVMDLTVFFTNDSPTWYKQVGSNQIVPVGFGLRKPNPRLTKPAGSVANLGWSPLPPKGQPSVLASFTPDQQSWPRKK